MRYKHAPELPVLSSIFSLARQGTKPEPARTQHARSWGLLLPVACAVTLAGSAAGENSINPPSAHKVKQAGTAWPPSWAVSRGRWILGLQAGYAVENAIPRNISHINMLIFQPSLSLIVHDFRLSRAPLRRFELVNEAILGNAVHPGGRLLGYTLLFRVDGRSVGHVVPFLDVGAGALHTTLHNRAPEISGGVQFTPQAGLGIQYFFSPQRAFVIEYRYLHMSNAGIQPPNHGFNASMLCVGLRWLRRPVS